MKTRLYRMTGTWALLLFLLIAALLLHSHRQIEKERWQRTYIRTLLEEEAAVRELLDAARGGETEEGLSDRAIEFLPGTEKVRYDERLDGLFLVTGEGFMREEGFLATDRVVLECPYPEIHLLVADAGEEICIYWMVYGWD